MKQNKNENKKFSDPAAKYSTNGTLCQKITSKGAYFLSFAHSTHKENNLWNLLTQQVYPLLNLFSTFSIQ
jgi:hypothetical protein